MFFCKRKYKNTFFIYSPLDLKSIKLCKFIFIYSCDFALNTIFYFNQKISDKYYYKGNDIFWFNLLNNLTISFISFIISFVIVAIFDLCTNSKDNIEEVFREKEKKMKYNKTYKINKKTKYNMIEKIFQINKNLKNKLLIFFLVEFLLMLFFYYFVTAFCEVYKQTQISWLIDSFISFLISFPVEFVMAFITCILYIISIKYRNKCMYKLAMILYNLG